MKDDGLCVMVMGDLDQELVALAAATNVTLVARCLAAATNVTHPELYPGFDLSIRRSESFVKNESNEFLIPSLFQLLLVVMFLSFGRYGM
jgi:hypothetical protein